MTKQLPTFTRKRKRGGVEKYIPEVHYPLIETYFSLGYIDKEVCKLIGIAESTLYEWYKAYPELKEAKKAKAIPNQQVEAAVFRGAIGHYREDKEIVGEVDEHGKFIGKRMAKISTKYIPTNATLAIFYLKNRASNRWKDVQAVDLSSLFVDLKVPLEPEEEKRIEAELDKTLTSAKLIKRIKADISK